MNLKDTKLTKIYLFTILIFFSAKSFGQFNAIIKEKLKTFNYINSDLKKESFWIDEKDGTWIGEYKDGNKSGVWLHVNKKNQLDSVVLNSIGEVLSEIDFDCNSKIEIEARDSNFVIQSMNINGFDIEGDGLKNYGSDLATKDFFNKLPELPFLKFDMKVTGGISMKLSKLFNSVFVMTFSIPTLNNDTIILNFSLSKETPYWALKEIYSIKKNLINSKKYKFNLDGKVSIICNYEFGLLDGDISIFNKNLNKYDILIFSNGRIKRKFLRKSYKKVYENHFNFEKNNLVLIEPIYFPWKKGIIYKGNRGSR